MMVFAHRSLGRGIVRAGTGYELAGRLVSVLYDFRHSAADENSEIDAVVDQGACSVNGDHLTFEPFKERMSRSGITVAGENRAAVTEVDVKHYGN